MSKITDGNGNEVQMTPDGLVVVEPAPTQSMTLLELKNLLLTKTDEELAKATITSCINVGCCGDVEYLEIDDVELVSMGKPNLLWLQIRHQNSLPGFESCRQYGMTRQRSEEYLKGKK